VKLAIESMPDWSWHFTKSAQAPTQALFLDRDGTLIENVPYLSDPTKVVLFPGVRECLARFRAAGFKVVIVTNQSAIARGLSGRAEYEAVQDRVLQLLGPGLVDAIYACPFHPEGFGEFRRSHPWRKPKPGMLLAAAQQLNLDLAESIMVGDSMVDIDAGFAAGVKKVFHVLTGHGKNERLKISDKYHNKRTDILFVNSVKEISP